MIAGILAHAWQSTVFTCALALLAPLLRRQAARVRYCLWLAASVKFLVPFSLLVWSGSWLAPRLDLPQHSVSIAGWASAGAMPLITLAPLPRAAAAAAHPDVQTLLLMVWLAGIAIAVTLRGSKWLRLRALVSSARVMDCNAPIPVKTAATRIEPGLVGLWRPVILLPEGLASRLSPQELRSVIAHEVCHFQRKDNVTATIHMIVETLFWFHPLTWWLGSRLLAERERACDESVIASGHDPRAYAAGILKVCRLCIASPLASAAGVSGADLKQRVELIMSGPTTYRVGTLTRWLLALGAISSLALPLLYGFLSTPAVSAAVPAATGSTSTAEIARLLYEQTRPQKEVPFNPADFDKYTGYYRFSDSGAFLHVFREGGHYLTQLTGQGPVEVFPESPSEFFATVVAAQISFETATDGRVTELVLHQNGHLQTASRTSQAAYEAAQAQLQRRLEANIPSPGTKSSLVRWIHSIEERDPNYDDMEPGLAAAARAQMPQIEWGFRRLGAFKSLSFVRVEPNGWDVYDGEFARGRAEFHIAPLAPDGKVGGRYWRILP